MLNFEARFQIKEILNPNSRRGDEIKAINHRLKNAKTLEETIGPSFGYEIPAPVSGYDLVRDNAHEIGNDPRYLKSKESLDLLFYVTRTRASLVQPREVKADELSLFGWRSISCLMGNHAYVLFARADAPEFLCRATTNPSVDQIA